MPVAWKILPAHAKGTWRLYREDLVTALQDRVSTGWLVLALAGRGLYARWLYTAIVPCGRHPFSQINLGAKYAP